MRVGNPKLSAELLETQCKHSLKSKKQGLPAIGESLNFCLSFTSKGSTNFFTVNVGEKSLCASVSGEGKRNRSEICQSILYFLTRFAPRKVFNQTLTCWGFIRAITNDLGKGNNLTPASSSHPIPPSKVPNREELKGTGGFRSICELYGAEAQILKD